MSEEREIDYEGRVSRITKRLAAYGSAVFRERALTEEQWVRVAQLVEKEMGGVHFYLDLPNGRGTFILEESPELP
jgi:hypothetical protein